MKTLYVAMIDDRHADTEPFLFTTPEAAIDFARDQAIDSSNTGRIDEEYTLEGWLYRATWGHEGDSVWVIEKTVEEAP